MFLFNNKGFSLIELLITVATLSVLTMGMAGFASNIFQNSYDHAGMIERVNNGRFSSSLIMEEISKASYIFPAGHFFYLSANSISYSVSTDNSIVFLEENTDGNYILKAFLIDDEQNLIEFIAETPANWDKNTLPFSNFAYQSGYANKLVSDIESTNSINYFLNYNNGTSDSVLKGGISGVTASSQYALIKAVEWSLQIRDKEYKIKGIAKNVPRYKN
ncbi:MAG: prepilin-type N-terminal cleavage/methylation domain-containing protein [Candidatus Gastranaerophilales bacterium]|nr:prepilin-type N-terminal cleavage/methylation domain-containing protein [Candidatus Gastranaerophilales bacterium]